MAVDIGCHSHGAWEAVTSQSMAFLPYQPRRVSLPGRAESGGVHWADSGGTRPPQSAKGRLCIKSWSPLFTLGFPGLVNELCFCLCLQSTRE